MADFLTRIDLLTLLIFTPLVGALILLFVPSRRVDIHRWGAFAISLVAFAISLLVAVAPRSHVFDKMVSNIQEVKARKGQVIAIVNHEDDVIDGLVADVLELDLVQDDVFWQD